MNSGIRNIDIFIYIYINIDILIRYKLASTMILIKISEMPLKLATCHNKRIFDLCY